MHPVLFEIAGFPVRSYGVALAVAFAVGIRVAMRRGERLGLNAEYLLEASIVILVASIVGSRLLYAATHVAEFRPPLGTWTDVFNPFGSAGRVGVSGLSMMGGVALAAVAAAGYVFARGLPVLRYLDVLAPSVLLGEGITRIGCFLNGCCFGTRCDLPWAVSFPAGSPAHPVFGGTGLHPAQLYSSFAGFALFAVLVWFARHARREGEIFFAFLACIGGARILLDLVRFYEETAILTRDPITVTVSQGVGLLLLAFAAAGVVAVRQSGTPAREG